MPNSPWEHCFVDPWRGVAHFDGLIIEADPISSARPDRVLPCIADEQVYFCRMMKALLLIDEYKQDRFAVDLGAGSGVLSLYAGSLDMRVTGIDTSARAIDFANYNLRQNKELLPNNGDRICFRRCNWNKRDEDDREYLDKLKGTADYVLINPPFSPSIDTITDPICAVGGLRGQDKFLETLKEAYSLLKEQGRVFVIHLLLTNENCYPTDEVSCQIGSDNAYWASVRIFPALHQKVFQEQDFLARQYHGYPKTPPAITLDSASKYFCFAFIELTKGKIEGEPKVEIILPASNPLAPLPDWTWNERIRMHRVVSGSSMNTDLSAFENQTRLPSISLFLQHAAPIISLHAQPESAMQSGSTQNLRPIQIALNSWIQNNMVLGDSWGIKLPYFDCIMVEAVPWHFARQRLKLETETTIWAANSEENSQSNVDNALKRIRNQIQVFHQESRSIFLHSTIVNSERRDWREAICFHKEEVISDQDKESHHRSRVEDGFVGEGKSRKTLISSHHEMLGALGVRDINPSNMSFEDCLKKALRDYTDIMRQERLLGKELSHCYLIAIPMPLPKQKSGNNSAGIVYVYAWSSQHWSPSHEIWIADIARVSAFLYGESYLEAIRSELTDWGREFYHQDPIINAIYDQYIRKIQENTKYWEHNECDILSQACIEYGREMWQADWNSQGDATNKAFHCRPDDWGTAYTIPSRPIQLNYLRHAVNQLDLGCELRWEPEDLAKFCFPIEPGIMFLLSLRELVLALKNGLKELVFREEAGKLYSLELVLNNHEEADFELSNFLGRFFEKGWKDYPTFSDTMEYIPGTGLCEAIFHLMHCRLSRIGGNKPWAQMFRNGNKKWTVWPSINDKGIKFYWGGRQTR